MNTHSWYGIIQLYAPETEFSFENTFVPSDAEIHDPIIEISTQYFTNENGDLR